MIKVIVTKDLKNNPDLVCTYCGIDHSNRSLDSIEGKDFVYETDGKEEWCICTECIIKFNN